MLQVDSILFAYDTAPVLDQISFTANKGEHLAVVGESGSGKTTLLKLIYGELDLDRGTIHWSGQEVRGPKFNLVTGENYIKYVAQEFDLMPYTSVAENIGKFLSNFDLEEKSRRINELLAVVELEELAATKVKLLSGGQKQRVALAQAMAKAPEIILLDEPFSHIDNYKKQSLRRRLFNFLKAQQITCIIATHDKEDVLPFADKMIVLHEGKAIAYGSPEQIYNNPESLRVASFFGDYNRIPSMGIVYASQLKVVAKSDLAVRVQKSYFKGAYYLIEADHNGETLFFHHHSTLAPDTTIYLEVLKTRA